MKYPKQQFQPKVVFDSREEDGPTPKPIIYREPITLPISEKSKSKQVKFENNKDSSNQESSGDEEQAPKS